MSQPDSEQEKPKRGRPEEPLVIEGDWEEAVKKALEAPTAQASAAENEEAADRE